MKYTPKTEEELEKEKQDAINASLMPNGEYDFEVLTVSDKKANSGADMITLKLGIFDENGDQRIVYDYLTESMGWKLRHAADSCGLLSHYDAGTLVASSFEMASGKVKLKTQKGNKDYPNPKNVVEDYVKRGDDQPIARAPVQAASVLNNDEIPF